MLLFPFTLQIIYSGRSMRSNHSTWDPRRPLYEELQPPPVPRRHYHGSDDCYHTHPHPPGILCFYGFRFPFILFFNFVAKIGSMILFIFKFQTSTKNYNSDYKVAEYGLLVLHRRISKWADFNFPTRNVSFFWASCRLLNLVQSSKSMIFLFSTFSTHDAEFHLAICSNFVVNLSINAA